MSPKKSFRMPTPMKITGRSSSITNSFINSIIPVIHPPEEEIIEALNILHLDSENLRCAYCGDKSTEWDHLRPLVLNQRPTGYISEIHNLVPACGKCNQSKGNKDWHVWIVSSAPLSPMSRDIKNLEEKINRLKEYENWKDIQPINFENLIGKDNWEQHWKNWKNVLETMKESQKLAEKINGTIAEKHKQI